VPSINTNSLTEAFNSYWQTNLTNSISDNLSKNNRQNIEVFSKVVSNNQTKTSTTKYIIPATTGTGKTQLTGFYIAKTLQEGFKSLVVVERTIGADELLKSMRSLIEPTEYHRVNTYHSNDTSTAKSIKEATSSQVLIITHKRFNDMLLESSSALDSNYDKLVDDRDLIAIDEAITTLEEVSVSKNYLYKIVAELQGIKTGVDKSHKGRYIAQVKLLNTIADDLSSHYDNPILDTDIMPYRPLLVDKELKKSTEVFDVVLEYLEEQPQMADTISKLHKIFNSDIQYLYKRGLDMYIKTVEEIIPNKSLVVLDATATVNRVYSYYTKHFSNIEVLPKIECRRYDNVNIHTFTTSTGKDTIMANSDIVAKSLSKSILDNTSKDDKVLVVVHKDLEYKLLSFLGSTDNIYINHWGNLTGSNEYKECNKIFIYGLFHKPLNIHYNNYRLSGNKFNLDLMLDEVERVKIQEIEKHDVATELIQAINRIRIRKVIDTLGNCDSADVYITLPQGDTIIQSMLRQEMVGATISNDWSVSKTLAKVDRTGNTEALIKVLNEFKETGKLVVTRDEARELIDASSEYKDPFRKNLSKTTTKAMLKLAGYEACKIPSKDKRGRTSNKNGFRYIGN
jgi:hypothetical protein